MATRRPNRRRALAFAVTLSAAGAGACVQVLGIEEDRFVASDESSALWSCLTATPPSAAAQNVEIFAFDLLNAPSLETSKLTEAPPVSSATVRACGLYDILCENPLPGMGVTDAGGRAVISVPASFTGFVEIDSDPFFPRLMYDDRLRTGAEGRLVLGFLLRKEQFSAIVPQLFGGIPLEQNEGIVYAEVYDCEGTFVNGVSFELERSTERTRSYYTLEGIPNASLLETTGQRGGGFINAPVGSYRLISKLRATGRVLNDTVISVRPGWFTTLLVGPAAP